MNEFIEKLKTIDWKRVGHWIIFPVIVIAAKFIGGVGGWVLGEASLSGMARSGIERSEFSDSLTKTLCIFVISLIACLNASFHFVPNKQYRYNALFLTAGTFLGIEVRNVVSYLEKYDTFRPIFLIDVVAISVVMFFIIQSILKEHPQRYSDSSE